MELTMFDYIYESSDEVKLQKSNMQKSPQKLLLKKHRQARKTKAKSKQTVSVTKPVLLNLIL